MFLKQQGFLIGMIKTFAFLQPNNRRSRRGDGNQSVENNPEAEIKSPRFVFDNWFGSTFPKKIPESHSANGMTNTQINLYMSSMVLVYLIVSKTGVLPQGGGKRETVKPLLFFLLVEIAASSES